MKTTHRIAAGVSALVLAGTLATATVAVPDAEAAQGYTSGCRAWTTFGGAAAGKCDRHSNWYQIEPYCVWWTGGTAYAGSGPAKWAPNTSSKTCPWGSSLRGAILWSPTGGNLAWVG